VTELADTFRKVATAEGLRTQALTAAPDGQGGPQSSVSRLALYLLGKDPLTVDIDGPALLVKGRMRAPRRFPFQRLSCVIAGRQAEWRSRALLACLEQGIPVIFVDGHGAPAGYLHAVNERASHLDELLRELLDRPDWQEHYESWLRAARVRVLEHWRTQRYRAGLPVSDPEYQKLLREDVYRFKPTQAAGNLYYAALIALTASLLKTAALAPRYQGLHGQTLDLQRDIADVLALSMRLEMGEFGAALDGQELAMLTAFHSLSARLNEEVRLLLGRLHRCLKERLEEWR